MGSVEKQEKVKISVEDVENGIRKMAKSKAPGMDSVQGVLV